jgi:SAP domain
MYLDEAQMTVAELKAIARELGMSTATKLNRKADLVRAITRYVEKREVGM